MEVENTQFKIKSCLKKVDRHLRKSGRKPIKIWLRPELPRFWKISGHPSKSWPDFRKFRRERKENWLDFFCPCSEFCPHHKTRLDSEKFLPEFFHSQKNHARLRKMSKQKHLIRDFVACFQNKMPESKNDRPE